MKKLLLSLLFAFVALTGLQAQTIWNGSTADTSWYNETSTEFEISTAEQLAGLAELVNNGKNFSDKTILLTADIVLNDTSNWENWENSAPANTWTPIGNSDNYNYFRGTFDGQGHTVSGVYINSENAYQGLFGYNNGTIKNVGLTNSYIKGDWRVGGVCGKNADYGTISDCYNSGNISGNNTIGGVCGNNELYGTISNCYNTGNVSGGSSVGGVCGDNWNQGTISNCYNSGSVNGTGEGNTYVGGVCGNNNGGISYCYNSGSVNGTGEGNTYVGGVCGRNNSGGISYCYNSGSVNGTGEEYTNVGGVCGSNSGGISYCYNSGSVNGTGEEYTDVGGVCGDNGPGTISNCYNTGNVSGNDIIGGVCGSNTINGTISNCYNSGSVNGTGEGNTYVGGVCGYNDYYGTISNCYNSGTVSGNYNVGGICGSNSSYGSIFNCYYLEGTAIGGINSNDVSGQAEVKSAEQFASGEVCWLLNEEQSEGAWGQKLGTDPCPVLGGPAVFKDGETYYNEEGSAIVETNSEQASFVIVPENLTINIYGSDGEATVYNLAGNIVYQGIERIIPVQNPGMYMVCIGNEVQKTIVR